MVVGEWVKGDGAELHTGAILSPQSTVLELARKTVPDPNICAIMPIPRGDFLKISRGAAAPESGGVDGS